MDEIPQISPLLPGWVPICAQRYLAHTEAGISIRNLARIGGVHASTVLRQVRRVELRRDDPLVDAVLTALAHAHYTLAAARTHRAGENKKDATPMTHDEDLPNTATLRREGCRILRRLCETGAVLAVAEQMEKAVVVRDDGKDGAGARTAVVDQSIARAMALQDWISCASPGRISRYVITAAGRSALSEMLAEAENRARCDQEMGFTRRRPVFPGLPAPAMTNSPAKTGVSEGCAIMHRKARLAPWPGAKTGMASPFWRANWCKPESGAGRFRTGADGPSGYPELGWVSDQWRKRGRLFCGRWAGWQQFGEGSSGAGASGSGAGP